MIFGLNIQCLINLHQDEKKKEKKIFLNIKIIQLNWKCDEIKHLIMRNNKQNYFDSNGKGKFVRYLEKFMKKEEKENKLNVIEIEINHEDIYDGNDHYTKIKILNIIMIILILENMFYCVDMLNC